MNGTNHPNVAPSHDDELAQVKRQCDKLKEALSLEKEQRQILKGNFISSSKGNFELRKEIRRLHKENARLAQRNPIEEHRFMDYEIVRVREDTYAKCLADLEAKIVVLVETHDAEIVVVDAKYEEKCKEAYILEAK